SFNSLAVAATPILSASFRASALNSAVCVLRIFFVDIIHLVKRLYSLSKVSKSVGTDHNTYNYLISKGYSSSDIYRPDWGSKSCAACNDHSGSEETPVRNALQQALASSCTGKIDVIGHSMGATLAAQQI